MNGNTWLEHRLVTFSDQTPPFLLEPDTPFEWNAIFSAAGFLEISNYSSSRLKLEPSAGRFDKLSERIEQSGVVIRHLDLEKFDHDLGAIYDLSSESFKDNFLYTSLSKEVFIGKYSEAKEHLDPELVLLAERGGELVAFVFCYPCLMNSGTLIVKTLASKKERSIAGIGTLLVEQVQQVALEKGYHSAIHALQFESNTSKKITARYPSCTFRKYSLLAIRSQ